MTYIWAGLAAMVLVVGVRYRRRLNSLCDDEGTPSIDDDAIQRIIQHGNLPMKEKPDLAAASEAEDEFWSEYWDEPDEYGR